MKQNQKKFQKRFCRIKLFVRMMNENEAYLNSAVFYGLTNLNNGFDAPAILYFSEADFEIILRRIEELKLGIYGIEPWLDGKYFDTAIQEDFSDDPTNPDWYWKAFEQFKSLNLPLQYAATYFIPEK